MISSTFLKSESKSLIKKDPVIIESEIDFDISDLPPPETVQGLWISTPSAVVSTSR